MNFWVKKTAIIFTLLMGILVLWYPVAAGTADTPDLTGISVSGLDKGLSGTSATFGSTLENARTASAGNSFAISPDTVISSGDVSFGRPSVSSLPLTTWNTGSTSAPIPTGAIPGAYDIGSLADGSSRLPGSEGEDNGAPLTVQLVVADPLKPDLVVTGVTAPSSATPGSRIMVSISVKNEGDTFALYSYTSLYLSADPTVDSGDTYLGKVYTSTLSAGSARTVSSMVTIPSGTGSGTYYLCVVADGTGRIAEEDEQNNTGSASLTVQGSSPTTPRPTVTPVPTTPPQGGPVKPDLIVTGVNAPATASPGSRVTISATVKNAGDTYAPYSYTSFYLSADPTVDTGDTYLGRAYTSSLSAGSARTVSSTATVPAGTVGGTYYVCAVADGTGRIAEKDEQNNTGSDSVVVQGNTPPTQPVTPLPTLTPVSPTPHPTVSPKPDLVMTGVGAPASASSGARITVTSTVKNAGDAPSSYSYTYFYLSSDTTVDSGDTYLGRVYISSLVAGSAKTVSYTVMVPSGTTAGNYYLCVLADGTARIGEQNEDNNTGSCSITVTGPPLPDLVSVSVTGPASGSPGGIISVQATISNGGTASSGETRAGFYLSRDPTITTSDTFLGSVPLPVLGTGTTTTLPGYVMIPAGVTPATYYLGVIADDSATVVESDEGNNAACCSGTIVLSATPAGTVEDQVEAAIIRYTNMERVNAGLPPLAVSPQLSAIARAHSLDMKVRDFFSHYNPDGLDPFERMVAGGYTYWCAAENIACTSYFTGSSIPDEVGRYFVQEMWMESSGHRANILNTCVTEIGVGVVYESDRSSSPYGFIASQNFGKPR
jgi:uncharacterized protein YkwD